MNLTSEFFADILNIISFIQYKNINNAFIMSCYKVYDTISVYKVFKENNIRAQFLNINEKFPVLRDDYYARVGIIVNTDCEKWTEIFEDLDKEVSFKYPYVWLIMSRDESITSKELSQYPIEIDADVTIIQKLKANHTKDNYEFFDVYNTGFYNNGIFKVQYAGLQNSRRNKVNKLSKMNLCGILLRITVVVPKDLTHETVEEYLVNSANNGIDSLHKLKFFIMLKYMQDMYNFTIKLNTTRSWGYVRNGSFDGMVGDLINGDADIGGSTIFFRMDRAKFIDYVAEAWPTRLSFVFRHPKHPKGFYTIYTKPLNHAVWYCILTLLILTGVSMLIILRVHIRNQSSKKQDLSISLAFLFSFASLCQQAMPICINTAAVKILIFVTLAYSVILYQYYNAVIVSTLLREPTTTIRSLKDLLHSNLKIGVDEVLYNKDYFQRTTEPIALELYRKKVVYDNNYNFYDPEKGMALVKKGEFAFHVDTNIAYNIMHKKFTEREICETREVIMLPPQKMAAVTTKRSPYKEHIAYGIRKMYESGLMRRFRTSLDTPKPKCTESPDSSKFSVSIREFSSPLAALAFGFIISTIFLLCEILQKNIYN